MKLEDKAHLELQECRVIRVLMDQEVHLVTEDTLEELECQKCQKVLLVKKDLLDLLNFKDHMDPLKLVAEG